MRALLIALLVVSGLWAGYWVVGSRALENAVVQWFTTPHGGLTASQSDISVSGFPNRFDLTITDPVLARPQIGWGWRAPFAQVFTMTWKPWHLIAALPNEQQIDTPQGQFTLRSSNLEGSLVLIPGTALALDRTVLSGEGLSLTAQSGWQISATKLTLASRLMPDDANAHEIGFDATTVTPDAGFRMSLAAQSTLPEQIDRLHLDAIVTFAAPLDRFSMPTPPPLTGVRVKQGLLRWGDLTISAQGEIAPDADGIAQGRIDLRVENWRQLVPVLIASGLITAEVSPTVTRAMELLAEQGQDPKILTIPLAFQSGRMSLGPLPLGPAPRLF